MGIVRKMQGGSRRFQIAFQESPQNAMCHNKMATIFFKIETRGPRLLIQEKASPGTAAYIQVVAQEKPARYAPRQVREPALMVVASKRLFPCRITFFAKLRRFNAWSC